MKTEVRPRAPYVDEQVMRRGNVVVVAQSWSFRPERESQPATVCH